MSVLLSVRATPVAHPLILEWVIRRLSEAQPQARGDRGGASLGRRAAHHPGLGAH